MGRFLPKTPIESKSAGFLCDAALYLDFYGGLLTGKQAEILDSYYNEDYSLSEIAQGLGISRQAAHDALRNGARALSEYEEKLGMVDGYRRGIKTAGDARAALSELRAGLFRIGEASGDAAPGLERLVEELDAIVTRIENSIAQYENSSR